MYTFLYKYELFLIYTLITVSTFHFCVESSKKVGYLSLCVYTFLDHFEQQFFFFKYCVSVLLCFVFVSFCLGLECLFFLRHRTTKKIPTLQ